MALTHPLARHPRLQPLAAALEANSKLTDAERIEMLDAAARDFGLSQLDVELGRNPAFISFAPAASGVSDDFRALVRQELARIEKATPIPNHLRIAGART